MASPNASEFERLIAALAEELGRRRMPFMVIGGQAVLLHGEPRLTQDIDVTLGAGPAAVKEVLAVCETLGLEPLPQDPAAFAIRTFVLPAAEPRTRVRVDFVFSTTPYERQAIARAVTLRLGGVDVPYASAEDLILHKLFAGRPRDIEDARGVAVRKGDALDWEYLGRWAAEFSSVEGREDLPERLADLRRSGS